MIRVLHDGENQEMLTNEPMELYNVFAFGKFEGSTLDEVMDEEPSYIRWCMDYVDNFEISDEALGYLESRE